MSRDRDARRGERHGERSLRIGGGGGGGGSREIMCLDGSMAGLRSSEVVVKMKMKMEMKIELKNVPDSSLYIQSLVVGE